jgi:hypothetical protein
MLPPFIIEQIRQREEQERRQRDNNHQPRVQLPIHMPAQPDDLSGDDDTDRGVVIVDLMG